MLYLIMKLRNLFEVYIRYSRFEYLKFEFYVILVVNICCR